MILLSIHPRFAEAIFDGTKKVELRRRAPKLMAGDEVVVFAIRSQGFIHRKVFDISIRRKSKSLRPWQRAPKELGETVLNGLTHP